MTRTLTIVLLTTFLLIANVAAQNGDARSKAFRPVKSQITEAQQKLKSDGLYAGPVDGKYNDSFRDALREYQRSNGLEAQGKLDEATLVKMSIALTDRQKGVAPAAGPKRATFRVTKDQIKEAQTILGRSGKFSGDPSGKYSKEFRDAIRAFQTESGIRRTGTLNRPTLEKLGIGLTESQAAVPSNPKDLEPSVTRGSRGPVFRASKAQISEVQEMLKGKGLFSGESTGKLDDETRAAIKQWQSSNNVKETGTLNKETLVAMGVELTSSQKNM